MVKPGAAALVLSLTLSGCAGLVTSAASGLAENLAAAIEEQDDPELVREAIPSYLLMLDSFAKSSNDAEILGAAAELYAAYGVAFVTDPERSKSLTARGREYGLRALCSADKAACRLSGVDFDTYEATVSAVDARASDALYSYAVSSLAYIQANADDFTALADLPKIEVALERILELDAGDKAGTVNMYLGILNTLRPPALGGKPEIGREYFERALELTAGRDLSVKVEYARGYARLIYDRKLHDKLLNEVLVSQVKQPGLTLVNSLAQKQARDLLATADEYF